jgi:hypothetical protein
MTVIPLRNTNRDKVPDCSCLVTAAAAGTFITGGGGVVDEEGWGTLGRPRPLCDRAGAALVIVIKLMIEIVEIERFKYCTTSSWKTSKTMIGVGCIDSQRTED